EVSWSRGGNNDARKSLRHDRAVVSQLDINLHGRAVTAEAERDCASGRDFTNQTAKLLFAFNRCAVEIENYVVLAQACFPSGSIGIYHCDFYSAFFFQLERGHAVCGHVANINPQIRASSCGGVKVALDWA